MFVSEALKVRNLDVEIFAIAKPAFKRVIHQDPDLHAVFQVAERFWNTTRETRRLPVSSTNPERQQEEERELIQEMDRLIIRAYACAEFTKEKDALLVIFANKRDFMPHWRPLTYTGNVTT